MRYEAETLLNCEEVKLRFLKEALGDEFKDDFDKLKSRFLGLDPDEMCEFFVVLYNDYDKPMKAIEGIKKCEMFGGSHSFRGLYSNDEEFFRDEIIEHYMFGDISNPEICDFIDYEALSRSYISYVVDRVYSNVLGVYLYYYKD